MASPDTQHAVVNSQSMGDESSVDSYAPHSNTTSAANGAATFPNKPEVEEVPQFNSPVNPAEAPSEQTANGHGPVPDGDTASMPGSLADDSMRGEAGSFADVGSDTDSRADEQGKDGNGSLKSVKKPASFKPVSVTRNFLAKTASAVASAITKPGEKTTPVTGTPVALARPRLVAKSGSGLRDSPRPRSGADSPADGATVWNKNRPAPPPPTKHFTDEELKQQYGIHLASRLQADDNTNKQSKWADIDDDEDDWAPETVEWMDGTKSTINPEPLPIAASKPATITIEQRPADARPILTPLKRPTGPPKTVLRPGAAIEQAKQDLATARDAQMQRATNGPKTPAPLPAKSPWAVLPPVDKAAPLTDFEALQPPPFRQAIGSQDARMMDGSFHAPMAREMEADTFDRTWRESDRGPRELFNSHSGRYEPAPEGRRGSMRREQGFRGPAVLRRPSMSGNSEAVMDSYQTRAQMDGSPWARRRGSSITTQDQHAFERRVSLSQKGSESSAPADGRTAVVIGHDIGPQAKQASKQAQSAQQQADERQEEVQRQKKIMQEKRELAIRRRKEEEEKEEAARRERIRIKLESLEKSAQAQTQTPSVANVTQHADGPQTSSTTADPDSRLKAEPLAPARSDPGPQPRTTADQIGLRSPEKARVAVAPRGSQEAATSTSPALLSSYPTTGDAKSHPSFRSPGLSADTFATWGNRAGQTANAPTSNVWGPPGASRQHIGNGAFSGNSAFSSPFSRIPPRVQNQNIGLTHNADFAATGRQGMRSASTGPRQETSPMRHQQMLSNQNLAALGLADSPSNNFQSPVPADPTPLPSQPLSPIAPPARQAQMAQSLQQSPRRGPPSWTQFAQQPQDDGVPRELAGQQPPAPQQRWKETFKQTKVHGDWTGARREVVSVQQASYGGSVGDAPLPPIIHSQPSPIGPKHTKESTVRLPDPGASPLRGDKSKLHSPAAANASGSHQSRFFPSSMIGGGSPPPEESSHPVYSGADKTKPTVNLPTPKPHVRLPPAALAAMQAQGSPAVIMPERSTSFRAGAQPIVQSSDWQARFNGLFGRITTTTAIPPSPPRTPPKIAAVPSPAPQSSSKDGLHYPTAGHPATVSLPFRTITSTTSTGDIRSKPTVDDIFDGELSFGSTPRVSVPRSPTYHPDQPDRSGMHILAMRPNAKFDKPIDSLSRPAMAYETPSNRAISVHIPLSALGAREVQVPAGQAERIFSDVSAGPKGRRNVRERKEAKVPTPGGEAVGKERKSSGKFKGIKVAKSRGEKTSAPASTA